LFGQTYFSFCLFELGPDSRAVSEHLAHAASTSAFILLSRGRLLGALHLVQPFSGKPNNNAKLKGQIKLNYFANGMLGKEADATQQVRIGAINMMISGTSIWATLVPEMGVLDLGYLFKDYSQVGKALDGSAGEKLSALMMDKANVMVLGYGFNLAREYLYQKGD
jgi:hypothetical protein